MRIFVAFQVSQEAKEECFRIQNQLKARFGSKDIKWVDEENMHGTLLFIGEVPEEKIVDVENILAKAAGKAEYLDFQLDGITAFPDLRDPRVLVVRLVDPAGMGGLLSKKFAKDMTAAEFEIDNKPWKAHLTLGRVKANGLRIKNFSDIESEKISWKVGCIELIKSDLGVNGSKYTVLKRFELLS